MKNILLHWTLFIYWVKKRHFYLYFSTWKEPFEALLCGLPVAYDSESEICCPWRTGLDKRWKERRYEHVWIIACNWKRVIMAWKMRSTNCNRDMKSGNCISVKHQKTKWFGCQLLKGNCPTNLYGHLAFRPRVVELKEGIQLMEFQQDFSRRRWFHGKCFRTPKAFSVYLLHELLKTFVMRDVFQTLLENYMLLITKCAIHLVFKCYYSTYYVFKIICYAYFLHFLPSPHWLIFFHFLLC